MNADNLDQAEALALRERLSLRATCLRVQVHAATGNAVAAPALSGDVLADLAALEIHVKELEAKLPMDAPPASNLSPTLTEKVLKARGVTKLSDLPPAKAD
jgi:hypothetical protein